MKLFTIAIIILSLSFLTSCTSQALENRTVAETETKAVETEKTSAIVDKVEIIHFHNTNQCYSCITVGDYAEYTINTYFEEEVKKGKVTFAHVNGELPQNMELVKKYGVTGSSLWIGVYDSDGFRKEENVNVWYKIKDKEDYADYLKGVIEKRLAGDLS
jgi:hypothetical protein